MANSKDTPPLWRIMWREPLRRLLLAACLCYLGGMLLAFVLPEGNRQRWVKETATADGTIDSYQIEHSIDVQHHTEATLYKPVVSYKTAAGETFKFTAEASSRQSIHEGQAVRVRYDPGLRVADIEEPKWSMRIPGYILLGLGTVFLGAAWRRRWRLRHAARAART